MELEIEVPRIYKPSFNDLRDEWCKKNLWYSPRTSWKSSGLGRIILLYYEAFPNYDVCIGVDSLTNAGEGVLSEFQAFIENEGLNENQEWVISSKCIFKKGRRNQIRVYPVQTNKHSDVNATKSKKLIRPISLFIMDEVQKLHNKKILLNCLSTFLRQMKAGHSKVILAGNPDRAAMWLDEFYKAKLKDSKWTVLKPTYLDIIEWIPKALLHEIEDLKENDPISYRQIYIGDLEAAGWEVVFHSFRKDKHYVKRQELIKLDARPERDNYIAKIIIGVDDAERQDALAASCITVNANGTMRVQESLYLSCKELTNKPALTERCQILIKFLDYIQEHFNPERLIPVIFSFDCAGGMYQQMVVTKRTDPNYFRWRNTQLYSYTTKQEKEEQLGKINSAFAEGILTVVNVNDYSPQYSNDKLVEQIHALMLLENGKIDPKIPNDATDALQYGVMMVLLNPYNLSMPKRLAQYRVEEAATRKKIYM